MGLKRNWPDTVCKERGRRRGKAGKTLVLIALAALAGGVTSGCGQADIRSPHHHPKLVIEDSVAEDFEALAMEVWDRFLTALQARSECFGDVRLRAARRLDSRGAYDPDSTTVTVRVPGTRAMLQSALIHEWAHHIEFQCEAHQSLRQAFLVAQGLPPDTPWRPDDSPAKTPESDWADIPSEQYAEATIELVLGDRQIPTKARVTRAAVRVIEEWAGGDSSSE